MIGQEERVSVLLEVINVNLEDLSKYFLDYDTDGGAYSLPKNGEYLLLIFQGKSGIFTTIRRRTPQKEQYYRSLIGAIFDVEVPEL